MMDAGEIPGGDIYHRIGHLTRTLHDAMRELGYDQSLANVRDRLPDARDRLTYIARVTGDAAEKVLNAVDEARSLQGELTGRAEQLKARWSAVHAFASGEGRATPAGRELIGETCEFLGAIGAQVDRTNAILTDIMMAQDFHDLTGQVIRKVVALAQTMEEQLVRMLLEATPPEQRPQAGEAVLDGPVVKAEGREDVVADQEGVDSLLASLGF
jgi:chemotaxis protein CheZ